MPAHGRHIILSFQKLFGGVNCSAYTMSKASTKNVNTNGRISVSQGQCVAMDKINTAVEIKNRIQYKPLFLFCISIWENFGKNRRGVDTTKDIFFRSGLRSLSWEAFLIFAEV
jgi:hypothetical protein